MIRDDIDIRCFVYGFVNLNDTELTHSRFSFLVDLRDKELALAKETAGSSAHTQLVSEKQQLETAISLFVADKVHMDDFDMQASISTNAAQQQLF